MRAGILALKELLRKKSRAEGCAGKKLEVEKRACAILSQDLKSSNRVIDGTKQVPATNIGSLSITQSASVPA